MSLFISTENYARTLTFIILPYQRYWPNFILIHPAVLGYVREKVLGKCEHIKNGLCIKY